MSRLLETIRSQIANAGDVAALIEAQTRQAIYLARRGENDVSRETIAAIRASAIGTLQNECIARANLAEGVLSFHTGSIECARDKLRRAFVLANAGRLSSISTWCAAWLGLIELNLGRPDGILTFAKIVIESAVPSDHSSLARVGLTIADGLHFAGKYGIARPWYEFARGHAVAEGDDVAIEAILHNVSAFRINNIRLDEIDGAVDQTELQRAKLDLASCLNYYAGIASRSFGWLLPMLKAQLNLLEGLHSEAVINLKRLIDTDFDNLPARLQSVALSDYSFGLAMTGNLELSALNEKAAHDLLPADLAWDERALIFHRFASSAALRKEPQMASIMHATAKDAVRMHREIQTQFTSVLSALPLPAELSTHGNVGSE